ncbi:hypothetical protein Pfo_028644 [Paulownia fortunei]|nr:hypothetical protein Pfo_028644 [Paulownia fortunei]
MEQTSSTPQPLSSSSPANLPTTAHSHLHRVATPLLPSHRKQPPVHSQIQTPHPPLNLQLRHNPSNLLPPKQGRHSIPDHGSNHPTPTSLFPRLPFLLLRLQHPLRFPLRRPLAVEWPLESLPIAPPLLPSACIIFFTDSPSYGQQSQIRQPMQGMGMTGTLGTTSSMRPAGVPSHQLRPSQSSLRPQTSSSSQSPAAQNFQGHGMLRVSSLGSPGHHHLVVLKVHSPRISHGCLLEHKETSFANPITSTSSEPSIISAKIPHSSATSP